MTPTRLRLFGSVVAAPLALGLTFAFALAGCSDPHPARRGADRPASSAEPAASAGDVLAASATAPEPGASASASASAKKPPPPPRVRVLDPPDAAKTPLPKPKDWTDIPRRQLVKRPEFECSLELLHEWARVTCDTQRANVALVTGSRDGVYLFSSADSSQLIFPVRRGDARVFEVHPNPRIEQSPGDYGGAFEVSGGEPAVVSELWLEGEDAPTIVVQ